MNLAGTEKDKVALAELETVIQQLERILREAKENLGKCRPVIHLSEIELVKDHLDLVVKYSKL